MIKRIVAFLLLFCAFFLNSCGRQEEKYKNAVMQKMSEYTPSNNVVLAIDDEVFYLNHFTLDTNKIAKNEESDDAYYLNENLLYFTTKKNCSLFLDTITLYSCDLRSGAITKIFSKDGYYEADTYIAEGKLYILNREKNGLFDRISTVVDTYNIKTGEYVRIDNGPYATLDKYKIDTKKQERYEVQIVKCESVKDNHFRITDMETGIEKVVDRNYVLKTPYAGVFSQQKTISPRMIDVVDGHILMAMDITAGGLVEYNNNYVIFEYDFENETLEYQLLAFPYDTIGLKFLYISDNT